MKTDELIRALAADGRREPFGLGRLLFGAIVLAVAVAFVVFIVTIGPRPDMETAALTPRFLFKLALVSLLALGALAFVRRIARPEAEWRVTALLAVPVLALLAVGAELIALPTEAWTMAAIGKNAIYCLTIIPLIGIAPLAILIAALRRGAPVRPTLAGAATGIAAGGIAAFFYALHCTDDSPLFVALWYSIAIGFLALVGAGAGRLALRW